MALLNSPLLNLLTTIDKIRLLHTIWKDCNRWRTWTCICQIWRWACSHFNCASHYILLIIKIIFSRFCIFNFPYEFGFWIGKEATPVGARNTAYKRTRIQSTWKVSGIRAWSNLKNMMISAPPPPDNIPLWYWNILQIPTIWEVPVSLFINLSVWVNNNLLEIKR